MCTIVAIKGVHPELPLVVAANRDEFYARPATPPRVVHEDPIAVAGVDLAKGGTWMGANARGLFVAITNQRAHVRLDEPLASRGEVVLEALAEEDTEGVDALLESLDAREYKSFNVIYGDARSLKVGYARTERRAVELEELSDGLWVLTNDRIGSPEFPKADRVLELVRPHVHEPWDALARALEQAMGDHEKPPLDRVPAPPPESRFDHGLLRELQAICIHTAVYGTRSSTLLALAPGRVVHYRFADGPPCTAPFRDVMPLFDR